MFYLEKVSLIYGKQKFINYLIIWADKISGVFCVAAFKKQTLSMSLSSKCEKSPQA